MTDLFCPRCGEPWDLDSLHELVDAGTSATFTDAARLFHTEGCGAAFNGRRCVKSDSFKAKAAEVLFDVLGDDVDGIASELADYTSSQSAVKNQRPYPDFCP